MLVGYHFLISNTINIGNSSIRCNFIYNQLTLFCSS